MQPDRRLLPLLVSALAACGGSERTPPTPGADAGRPADAGTLADAAPGEDGGPTSDGGPSDAGLADGGAPEGPQWFEVQVASGLRWTRIVGSGPSDVFLLGVEGQSARVFHFDGARFAEVPYEVAGCPHPLADVASAGPGRLVGFSRGCQGVLRYDGAWQMEMVTGFDARQAESVWQASDGTTFFGGRRRFSRIAGGQLASEEVMSPVVQSFVALHGTSSTDVWFGSVHELYRFDGATSTRVQALLGATPTAIWARAPDDAWFLDANPAEAQNSIWHWDGARFTEHEIGRAHGGQVYAPAPRIAWRTGGGLFRYSGLAWQVAEVPSILGELRPAFGNGEEDLWFGGEDGRVLRFALPARVPGGRPVAVPLEEVQVEQPVGQGPAHLRFLNAAAGSLRFCSSAGGALTNRPLEGGEHAGYAPVAIPDNGVGVVQLQVWAEPGSLPQACAAGGAGRTRRTLYLRAGWRVTVVGWLDPTDDVLLLSDLFRAPDSGEGEVRVLNAARHRGPVDVCASGSPWQAGLRPGSSTGYRTFAEGEFALQVHDAATPACSGPTRETVRVQVSAGASHTAALLDGRTAKVCDDAAAGEPRSPSPCR